MKSKSNEKVTHTVSSNIIWNGLLKIFGVIFPLITFPYATRCLGADALGRVSFVSSVISYFSLCANLGIPTYGIRACSKVRDNKKELSRTVHEILLINIATTIISYLLLYLSVLFIPRFARESELICVTSISLIFSCMGMEWLYSAIEEYRYITIRSFMFKILSIILLYVGVKDPSDYLVYAGITVIASVGSNVFNLVRIRKIIYIRPVGNYHFTKHYKPIITFFAASVAILIYTHIDTTMLGFFSSDAEVGYYTVAVKLKTVLLSAITSVGVVLLPRVTYYLSMQNEEKANRLIRTSFHLIVAVSLPLFVFFEIKAHESILLIAGKEYLQAQSSMMILMPLLLIVGCSNILVYQFILPRGMEKNYCRITVVSALIDIVINAWLIPINGALGAAIGTVVAEIVGLILMICLLKKSISTTFNGMKLHSVFISAMTAIAVTKCSSFIISKIESSFWNLFISALIFGSTYVLTLLITKDALIMEMVKTIKTKFINFRQGN